MKNAHSHSKVIEAAENEENWGHKNQVSKELPEGGVGQQVKEPRKLLWFECGLSPLKGVLESDCQGGSVGRWGLIRGVWVLRQKPSQTD